MKFKFAVIFSIILHISLFALAIYVPRIQKSRGTIYYVDLLQMPGSGGPKLASSKGINGQLIDSGSVRDLTIKKEPPKSKLRYPYKKSNKINQNEKKKEKLITVVKKNNNKFKKDESKFITTQRKGSGSNVLRTGISSGSRAGGSSGLGSVSGSGSGYGNGIGSGFPYAYYIDTIRNKISASWYRSLVSPGLKGKYAAVVYFRILRSGMITDLELEEKSGNDSLDLSALRAVRAAGPFPQLPPDFIGSYLGVHFEFEWER